MFPSHDPKGDTSKAIGILPPSFVVNFLNSSNSFFAVSLVIISTPLII